MLLWIPALFYLLGGAAISSDAIESYSSGYKVFQPGDFIIGGLFAFHGDRSSQDADPLDVDQCSDRLNAPHIFLPDTLIASIDAINNLSRILPDVTLGYDIRDTCGNPVTTMYHAYDIYAATRHHLHTCRHQEEKLQMLEFVPDMNGDHPACETWPLIGVIGPADSPSSAAVSSLFLTDHIPVISYASTSPKLSTARYPSFMRTVPSDLKLATAISDLVILFHWNYIAIFSTDDEFGREGIYEFKNQLTLQDSSVCIALEEYLPMDATSSDAREIMLKLNDTRRHKSGDRAVEVVLLFMEWRFAKLVIKEADTLNVTDVTWIGVDEWSAEHSAEYFSSLNIRSETINGMLGVILDSSRRRKPPLCMPTFNPWRDEYRMLSEQCNPLDLYTLHSTCQPPWFNCTQAPCTDYLELFRSCFSLYNAATKAASVTNAVHALVFGLHTLLYNTTIIAANNTGSGEEEQIIVTRKESEWGDCSNNSKSQYYINYERLLEHIRDISFKEDDGEGYVSFTNGGDIQDAVYDIINTYIEDNSSTRKLHSQLVGKWKEDAPADTHLQLNVTAIVWKSGSSPPRSVCSEPCLPGSHYLVSPQKCCWECLPCEQGSYSNKSMADECTVCPHYSHINLQRSRCTPNHDTWFRWDSGGFSYVILVLASLGELVTVACIALVFHYRLDPLILGLSLKHVLLTTSLVNFLICVPFMMQSSKVICIVRIVHIHFCYHMNVASLLVRTAVFKRWFEHLSRHVKCYLGGSCNPGQLQVVVLWLVKVLLDIMCLIGMFIKVPDREIFVLAGDTDVDSAGAVLRTNFYHCTSHASSTYDHIYHFAAHLLIVLAAVLNAISTAKRQLLHKTSRTERGSESQLTITAADAGAVTAQVDDDRLISNTCYVTLLILVTLMPLAFFGNHLARNSPELEIVIAVAAFNFLQFAQLGFTFFSRFYVIYRRNRKTAALTRQLHAALQLQSSNISDNAFQS